MDNAQQEGWTYKRLRVYSRLRPSVAELIGPRIQGNRIKNLEEELSSCERTNMMLDVIEDTLQGDHTPCQLQKILELMLRQEPNALTRHKQLRDCMAILKRGDEMLKRLCWVYAKKPDLFGSTYVMNSQDFKTDQANSRDYPYMSLFPLVHSRNAGLMLNGELWQTYGTVFYEPVNSAYTQDPKREEPYQNWAKSGTWGSKEVLGGANAEKVLKQIEQKMFPSRANTAGISR